VVEHLGSLQLIHLQAHGRRIVSQIAEAPGIRRGDAVKFSIDPNQLYLFSAQTGAALRTPGRRGQGQKSFSEKTK
jgi:hypothetical protein